MAVNIFPNPSLESGIAAWTANGGTSIEQSTTQAWDQTYSLLAILSTNSYSGCNSSTAKINVSESTQYTLSYYAYPDTATVAPLKTNINDQDGNQIASVVTDPLTADEWTRITKTFTTGAGDTSVYFAIQKNNHAGEGNLYLDGFMLETGGSASEWVDYVDAAVELVIADASLALSADGSGSIDGLWDLGAYIYTSGSGIVLEVGGVDVLLAIANASLALSSESPALGPALLIANASLALSSENVVFQSSVSIDANRIARIIFVMKNG